MLAAGKATYAAIDDVFPASTSDIVLPAAASTASSSHASASASVRDLLQQIIETSQFTETSTCLDRLTRWVEYLAGDMASIHAFLAVPSYPFVRSSSDRDASDLDYNP